MLSNAYFLAKVRFDTAENEPAKNLQKKIENFEKFANPNPLRRSRENPQVNDRRKTSVSFVMAQFFQAHADVPPAEGGPGGAGGRAA